MRNAKILDQQIDTLGIKSVLFASYSEYLAPLWAHRFRGYAENRDVWFGAMALDPIRDYVVGPKWWHARSIRAGYSFLHDVFVHHPIDLKSHGAGDIPVTVVPHGEYPMPNPTGTKQELRKRLDVPDGNAVALCYGHLRDNKNLKNSLVSLTHNDRVTLVVAGSDAAPGQMQADAYLKIAQELGVNDRVRWKIGYQSDEDTADLFAAADVLLLPYDKSFVSSSGILHVATPFEIPLVVSCGDGPLGHAVEKYQLGIRMPCSEPKLIANGIRQIQESPIASDWNGFRAEHSYERNAQILVDRITTFHRTPHS
ncbi:glycosyltransferase [Rhodopirellula sallentina]|nr:glycosyltransferase [Rhodopirellula sallentina]